MRHGQKIKNLFLALVICILFSPGFSETQILECLDCSAHDSIELECFVCLKIEISRASARHTDLTSIFIGCPLSPFLININQTDFCKHTLSLITLKARLNN